MLDKASLKAITDAPGPVESFKAVLDALVANQTIGTDAAGLVKAALDHNKAVLEPAILANVKPPKAESSKSHN